MDKGEHYQFSEKNVLYRTMMYAIINKQINKTVRNHPVYNLKLRNVYL